MSTRKTLRLVARISLGAGLLVAGISHLSWNRHEFLAQVPEWVPVKPDTVVLGSGVAEIALGSALVALPNKRRSIGLITALFFIAVFPGNISQFVTKTDGFGLNSDRARGLRLAFQPVLVMWALIASR